VDFGQEFRGRRERAAIEQDVDGPSERRLAGLLKAQVGMVECVDPAISSELGFSLRDSEVIVVVGVLWKKTETPIIDDEVVVVLERCINQVGKQELPKLVFTPPLPLTSRMSALEALD